MSEDLDVRTFNRNLSSRALVRPPRQRGFIHKRPLSLSLRWSLSTSVLSNKWRCIWKLKLHGNFNVWTSLWERGMSTADTMWLPSTFDVFQLRSLIRSLQHFQHVFTAVQFHLQKLLVSQTKGNDQLPRICFFWNSYLNLLEKKNPNDNHIHLYFVLRCTEYVRVQQVRSTFVNNFFEYLNVRKSGKSSKTSWWEMLHMALENAENIYALANRADAEAAACKASRQRIHTVSHPRELSSCAGILDLDLRNFDLFLCFKIVWWCFRVNHQAHAYYFTLWRTCPAIHS